MHTHRAARIVAAAVVIIAAHLTTAPTPAALADNCPDIQVVYARGTDTIPPVDQVGQGLVNALSAQLPGKSLSVYGIN